ncbi:MAG: hypothetical protein ABIQ99_07800, partial [Thermoflexales bacterium]
MRQISLSAEPARIALFAGYAVFIVALGIATANIDPFNSDTVANLIAVTSIDPNGTLYVVAHSNVLKAPLYLLSMALFGRSQNALAFIDTLSTIGFNALIFVCLMVWTKDFARRHLAALPLAYLACLSPLYLTLTVSAAQRNLDIGVSFVWLALILGDTWKLRYRLLGIPLAAILVINDPWFVTTFAFPAIMVALLVRMAPTTRGFLTSRVTSVAIAVAGVTLGFAIRTGIEATGLAQFVASESEYRVVTAQRLGFNLGLTAEVLLRYFNAWVFEQPLVSVAVFRGFANLALVGIGIAGLFAGARAADRLIRRVSVFALIAIATNLCL